ncbi:abscisate beta-glucosyltransferase [Ricinus communis]|uniref:Glycosyltransferase n=1 Tax=Ricinus communis TaxID=3988 RepID=B9RYF1_RICCO|nr:abscisate beta-glucosyltransferase [Ricinus communis]EEF43660.1 UDP-glucosyltransferase, putative [Ricinus communis]|eukprot:XP_002518735.1 abscisate beta-glucosyltransferase [Ricinus communis]
MESNPSPVEMFFLPFVGGGHQIPMIDIARIFASHGAKSTIITTPKHALSFQKSIDRDQKSGRPISIHILELPDNVDIADTDMSAGPFTDTSMLREPFLNLLHESRPDCIVHDVFHRWSGDAIDGAGIPRITFSGNACFPKCVQENMRRFKPHEKVSSDLEPFVVPGLPDRIELTRSQLAPFERNPREDDYLRRSVQQSFGVVVNSFYELEPAYAELLQKEMGNKAWLVGPVSLCNRNIEDKAERGQKTAMDQQSILSWLDSKEPNSVLYISFGSLARLSHEQLLEIAYGLEASNHQFIWVVGKTLKSTEEEEENVFLGGFEDRLRESGKGLIIRGWAPQLLILEHNAVGGFVTHCGWNSTLEGVSCGVPMITWPITAEQFTNEKLITDVLKIGVKVGSMEWSSFKDPPLGATVGRDKVETAVKRLMAEGEEAAEFRRRAKELGEKAKRAVEEGGSSYKNADALIQELISLKRN